MWLIEIAFLQHEILVVHSKKAISQTDSTKDYFEFVWHLSLHCERSLERMTKVQLTITNLEVSEEMKEARKKKLFNVANCEYFV